MHDAKILALLQKDAARGLAALSAQYGGLMVSICRAVLPQHPQDAEEAAADTLVHLWRTAPALPADAPLAAVCANAARQKAIDRVRRLRRAGETCELPEETHDALVLAEQLESREDTARLRALIAALPPPDGALVVRKYYYLESTRALAQRYHLTENAVNCRLRRAKETLRAQLAETEGAL